MMARKSFATLLVALALVCLMNLGSLVEVRADTKTPRIPEPECSPILATDRASCEKKFKPCLNDWGVQMKW
jgi:hypothetical protein